MDRFNPCARSLIWVHTIAETNLNLEDFSMKYLQLLAVLLLSVVWATAQTTTTQAPASDPTATTASTQSGMTPTSAGADSVQGCLSGADGSYTLTDQTGASYRLTGDTAKLSEHIGHEVKVTGTKSTATATGASDTMGQTGGAQQAIQVSSVKHVAKTCQTSAPATK
jgi:hypothetical protein